MASEESLKKAREIAAKANECCYRSDGYEEQILDLIVKAFCNEPLESSKAKALELWHEYNAAVQTQGQNLPQYFVDLVSIALETPSKPKEPWPTRQEFADAHTPDTPDRYFAKMEAYDYLSSFARPRTALSDKEIETAFFEKSHPWNEGLASRAERLAAFHDGARFARGKLLGEGNENG